MLFEAVKGFFLTAPLVLVFRLYTPMSPDQCVQEQLSALPQKMGDKCLETCSAANTFEGTQFDTFHCSDRYRPKEVYFGESVQGGGYINYT